MLSGRHFLAIFSRDQLTADDLSEQLARPVQFLGNPFMDPVLTATQPLARAEQPLARAQHRIGLLPGSRLPELEANLQLLLKMSAQLPDNMGISLELALVSSLDDKGLSRCANAVGWQLREGRLERQGAPAVQVHRGAFQAVLQHSDLVISMAGTAAEQAVGLAKPVLQLPGQGPQFTASFAEAQRRLLGPTVFCAPGDSGSRDNLSASAQLALQLLKRIDHDRDFQHQCQNEALRRLGNSGGGLRMASAIGGLCPSTAP
jgi:uncharacterized protein (TIGR03492 family)